MGRGRTGTGTGWGWGQDQGWDGDGMGLGTRWVVSRPCSQDAAGSGRETEAAHPCRPHPPRGPSCDCSQGTAVATGRWYRSTQKGLETVGSQGACAMAAGSGRRRCAGLRCPRPRPHPHPRPPALLSGCQGHGHFGLSGRFLRSAEDVTECNGDLGGSREGATREPCLASPHVGQEPLLLLQRRRPRDRATLGNRALQESKAVLGMRRRGGVGKGEWGPPPQRLPT